MRRATTNTQLLYTHAYTLVYGRMWSVVVGAVVLSYAYVYIFVYVFVYIYRNSRRRVRRGREVEESRNLSFDPAPASPLRKAQKDAKTWPRLHDANVKMGTNPRTGLHGRAFTHFLNVL